MLLYRAALPLSRKTLNYTAEIIRRYRASIGSLWRKLNPGRQALLVLAHLRKGKTFAELTAGFRIGTTTAWRYVNETVELLAARAAKLRTAVRDATKAGYADVLDGDVVADEREIRAEHRARDRRHGQRVVVDQADYRERGEPFRTASDREPGTHRIRYLVGAVSQAICQGQFGLTAAVHPHNTGKSILLSNRATSCASSASPAGCRPPPWPNVLAC